MAAELSRTCRLRVLLNCCLSSRRFISSACFIWTVFIAFIVRSVDCELEIFLSFCFAVQEHFCCTCSCRCFSVTAGGSLSDQKIGLQPDSYSIGLSLSNILKDSFKKKRKKAFSSVTDALQFHLV